jgi:hypothetical protein
MASVAVGLAIVLMGALLWAPRRGLSRRDIASCCRPATEAVSKAAAAQMPESDALRLGALGVCFILVGLTFVVLAIVA